MNPLTTIRRQLLYTQANIATLAGITLWTVKEAEAGMFSRPQPSITRVLSQRSGIPVEKIAEDYYRFQSEVRRNNLQRLIVDMVNVDSFESYAVAVGGSARGFCRVVLLQVSVLNGYLSSGARWSGVRDVLLEAGVPADFVQMLGELPRV